MGITACSSDIPQMTLSCQGLLLSFSTSLVALGEQLRPCVRLPTFWSPPRPPVLSSSSLKPEATP